VRNHFGMSRVSQAGALAALADQDWLAHAVAETAASRTRVAEVARAAGLTPLPSATNFVTVACGAGPDLARALVAALAREGVFVRMPFAAPGNRCIRIGAGTPRDLEILETILPSAVKAARASFDSSREHRGTLGS
jgi:histidinol-phosphate aminotransferase